jgi:effector-binding domain-containing protein
LEAADSGQSVPPTQPFDPYQTSNKGIAAMLAKPQIIETTALAAAVIRLTIPRGEMMKAFGPAAGELMSALAAQGIKPEGAMFAHHLKMSADAFDFELGVTVSTPVKPAGRVKPGELPAAKVARVVYGGPYEGLPAAWGEFTKWIKANGHEPAEDLWELYAVGPQSTPDPAGWRTELNRPLES